MVLVHLTTNCEGYFVNHLARITVPVQLYAMVQRVDDASTWALRPNILSEFGVCYEDKRPMFVGACYKREMIQYQGLWPHKPER